MPKGKCKLCLRENVELQNSHLIPAAAYKLIRNSDGSTPIVMKSTVTIKKDEQVTDYLLCGDCEQRFSNQGEQYVLRYCNNFEGGFRLNNLLDTLKPLEVHNTTAIYAGGQIPEIDMEKLAYFAASIMWRGSAHSWRSGKDPAKTPSLGSHEESFRKYLMGEGPFPEHAFLGVDVVSDKNLWPLVFVPYGGRGDDMTWTYVFPFLGLIFLFRVGNSIPKDLLRFCAYRSPEKIITRGAMKSDTMINDAGLLMAKSRVVGQLKKG
jgi:hypothetical protein